MQQYDNRTKKMFLYAKCSRALTILESLPSAVHFKLKPCQKDLIIESVAPFYNAKDIKLAKFIA